MSFWQWTQFHIFLLIKSLQSLINKGNIAIFYRYKNFAFLPLFWVSRYLLDTQRKVCKKASKIFFNFQALKKPLFYGLLAIYRNNFYIFSRTTWIKNLLFLALYCSLFSLFFMLFCFWLHLVALGLHYKSYLKSYLNFYLISFSNAFAFNIVFETNFPL